MSRSFNKVLVLLFAATPQVVRAQTLSFAEVWQEIRRNSPALEGTKLKAEAAEEGLSRAQKHWLPKLYVDAKAYNTNDPGANLIGLLEQRKVGSADFSPESLNHPDARNFIRGAVGLDLPLYEGGMKQAQAQMSGSLAQMERLEAFRTETELYTQSVLAFGTISSTQKQSAKLKDLSGIVSRLIKSYELGQKSNPVGYSGLLGMKSLANRLEGVSTQLETQERSSFAALREMGVSKATWTPSPTDVRELTQKLLPYAPAEGGAASYGLLAHQLGAKALGSAAQMEKARFLPRAGAFAESYMFKGSRDTGDGYTAGIYLQWSLFDPADYGKYKEARLKYQAAEKMSEAGRRQEIAERFGLIEAHRALRANLALLDDSDKLLADQTRVSAGLFKNGSMNVLQFVELLNRRTDLIVQQSEAEIGLLKISALIAQKSKFSIPNDTQLGEKK
jgi:hypothetical protein